MEELSGTSRAKDIFRKFFFIFHKVIGTRIINEELISLIPQLNLFVKLHNIILHLKFYFQTNIQK